MIKTEKLGKLSISLGLILVVFLLMAFAFGTTANADELDDAEVVEATENTALNDVVDAVKDAIPAADENSVKTVTGLPSIVDDDFASKEGENYNGGFHWYLFIKNYMFLPDDFEITLWSNTSEPHYYQVLDKANLIQRLGYIRIPAGPMVYVKTNYDMDCWRMQQSMS